MDFPPQEQVGFAAKQSTIDMMFALRRQQKLGWARNTPLKPRFIDQPKVEGSVDCTPLREVFLRVRVRIRVLRVGLGLVSDSAADYQGHVYLSRRHARLDTGG